MPLPGWDGHGTEEGEQWGYRSRGRLVPSLISQAWSNPASANSGFLCGSPRPFVPWGLSLRSAEPKGQTVPRGGS